VLNRPHEESAEEERHLAALEWPQLSNTGEELGDARAQSSPRSVWRERMNHTPKTPTAATNTRRDMCSAGIPKRAE
jgi:hypothetical protein